MRETAEQVPVITVDGPSGSGKGTVSRLVATQLGWHFLDSGALYRLVGLAALEQGVAMDNAPVLSKLAANLDVRFIDADAARPEGRILLQGRDVSDDIRSETCARAASCVAGLMPVRQALLELQRGFCRMPGLVADGRDMGTVVFPNATVKIYLVASAEERAKRRYKQLKEKGIDGSLGTFLKEIRERDARDSGRSISPLTKAEDAIVIDSTDMTIMEVVSGIVACWEKVKHKTENRQGVPES